jgi:threonine/homoserine/homoserine lactone efflux protein
MSLDTWLLYVTTTLIFMSTPGPSHLLMLSTSMSNGFRRSLATAAGDLTANTLQILLAGFGLAAVITASRHGLAIVKWGGVIYLVWVGARQILNSLRIGDSHYELPRASFRTLWLRGFVTSASNPKAVVFFVALFPQFLDPTRSLGLQIFILGATFIVIDGAFLAFYGKSAAWLASKLDRRRKPWVDRAGGIGIIAAAVMLGLRATDRS